MNEVMQAARTVKSAERVLDLLQHLSRQSDGSTFSALARDLEIPKSSLHGLLDVLTSRGFVELRPGSRTYALGLGLWEAGQAYRRHHNVVREARVVLEAVVEQVNETAQLARLVGRENIYLFKVDSSHPLRLQSEVGGRLPAHATGVGKALLSVLDDAEVRRRLGEGRLETFSANTIASVPALLDELAVIRRRGFAIDNEEYTRGVFCIAAVVHEANGVASTAVSVSVPVNRARRHGLETILSVVADASLQLSRRCGVPAPQPRLVELTRPETARIALNELVASGRYDLPWLD